MIYISDQDVCHAAVDWQKVRNTILEGIRLIQAGDFAQPVKPYLRFRDPVNRIIAMPAFAGGQVEIAGIKWIASFPGNVGRGLQRAHSVTILNDALTGKPLCIINSGKLSAIRTAGVTAVMVGEYLHSAMAPDAPVTVGIIGFGPIGQTHADMCWSMFGSKIRRIVVYDPRCTGLGADTDRWPCLEYADSWQEVYQEADVLITATVSNKRYIDLPPRSGALYCNISLRDFQLISMQQMSRFIVDDWEEVCRENTDVECLHRDGKLFPDSAYSFTRNPIGEWFSDINSTGSVMFNPMGLAVFDICIGKLFYEEALLGGIGAVLGEHSAVSDGFLW